MLDTQRILIVEDERLLRDAFALLLRSQGYEVGLAENGKIGLKMARSFQPDLILLDLLMPAMNGIEFLQNLALSRKQHGRPRPKTLVLSNLSDPINPLDIDRLGITRSVLKADLSPDELAATIRDILEIEEA